MNMRRFLVLLLILLIIVVAGYATRGLLMRWNTGPAQTFLEALRPGVDVELSEIRFSETRQGIKKYLLTASSATYSARGVSLVKNIDIVFFDVSGRETMRLRADEGDLAGNEQLVTLQGNVLLTGAQGYTLSSDHLTYRKEDDLLETDAAVILKSSMGILRGRGLKAFPQQERLQLLHDVSGEFIPQTVDLKLKHGQG